MVYEGLIMGLSEGAFGLISGGIGALGSIGSSIVSNAASARAQKRAYQYARQLQQQQYDLSQQGYRETPSNQRVGMESAGYNPMLALGNVGSSSAVAGGTPVNANATDTSGIKESIMQMSSMRNQTKQTDATVENLDSGTRKNDAEAQGTILHNKYIDDREKSEIANIQADTQQKSAVIENMKQRIELDRMLGILGYNASIYGSNASSSAMRYGATLSSNATKYSADKSLEGSFGHSATTLGLGLLGMYGLGKIKPKNIKKVGQLIKVAPKLIHLP